MATICCNCSKRMGWSDPEKYIKYKQHPLCGSCFKQIGSYAELDALMLNKCTDNETFYNVYTKVTNSIARADFSEKLKQDLFNDLEDVINDYKKIHPEIKIGRDRIEVAKNQIAESEEEKQQIKSIIVTTGDLKKEYDIIGPVFYQINNKGLFASMLDEKLSIYNKEIASLYSSGQLSEEWPDYGIFYGEWSVGQNDFEKAFYIAAHELKKKARLLGADAIIGMRQDIDIDTSGFKFFYLQMYGTAVKFKANCGLHDDKG